MTAPLFNLPIMNPIAGPAAASTGGQGPLGGFEALLAAFFGPAEQTAGAGAGLLAASPDGETADSAGEDQKSAGEAAGADPAALTPAPAADPMMLAALLVAPQAVVQTVQAPPAEVGGDAPAPTPAASTPVFAPAIAADAEPTPPDAAPTPQTQSAAAPAAAEAFAAAPAPLAKPGAEPRPQAKLEPKVQPQAPAAAQPKPANAQPQVAAPAPTSAAAVEAPAAQLAQTEAAAPALDEAKPQEPQQAARPGRHTETGRRRGDLAPGAAPTPADDVAITPNAVTAAAGAGEAGKSGDALEPELAPSPAKEAKSEPPGADVRDARPAIPAAPAALAHASPHAAPLRATSETIANLTAQISKKLEGRATKFDVELTPAGLGHVSVSVEIAASGKMTAAMSFDTPQAAAEVRARSHELQRALEQAGFDLAGGLTFDVTGDRGGDGRGLAQQQQQQNDGAWRGRAFQAVLGAAGEAAETAALAALQYARRTDTGVDIRI